MSQKLYTATQRALNKMGIFHLVSSCIAALPLFAITTACGKASHDQVSSSWHLSPTIEQDAAPLKIAVPYASGDVTGELTDRIIFSLQTLPNLTIDDNAPYLLSITILDDQEEKIGYRYDPLDKNTKIIPNENRSKMLVSVSLIERSSKKTLWGPAYILGTIDYDHQNSSINNNILAYSMGQLADIDTAQDVTYIPLHRDIGNKIAIWFQNEREIKSIKKL